MEKVPEYLMCFPPENTVVSQNWSHEKQVFSSPYSLPIFLFTKGQWYTVSESESGTYSVYVTHSGPLSSNNFLVTFLISA